MRIGYFDTDGVCIKIIDGQGSIDAAYSASVKPGLLPHHVYYDTKTGKAKKARETVLKIPDIVSIGSKIEVKLPDHCVAIVNGERVSGSVVLDTSKPSVIMIDVRGKVYGNHVVKVDGYAESRARAYMSVEDQLDMIYHHGIDAWREHVDAVKKTYPKPE